MRSWFGLVACALSVACGGSGGSSVLPDDDAGPGTSASPDGGPGSSKDEGPSVPHALASIVLGEMHVAGESTTTPIVSATFAPNTKKRGACTTKIEGCTMASTPRCTGCADGEVCAWNDACSATCQKIPSCSTPCEVDETCVLDGKSSSGRGKCQKTPTFDAGPIAFSGTTSSITLFPPYAYEANDDGAPFLGGAEMRVKAQGAVSAGFAAFDEKFTATSFIQTNPTLQKLSREKVFGAGPLPVGWVPGEDEVVVTVTSAYGSATCVAKDADGHFDVPRAVIDAVRTAPRVDGARPIKDSSVTTSVTRQRKEVKKNLKTKGTLENVTVEPVGWLELVTSSAETASFEGCSDAAVACGNACVDLETDQANCGSCGKTCGANEHCDAGKCSVGAVCVPGAEDTLEACSDGCSNDGDPYIDCDDFGCCAARTNCPATTACGKR